MPVNNISAGARVRSAVNRGKYGKDKKRSSRKVGRK